MRAFNPNTWEADTGFCFGSQPSLHRKFQLLSENLPEKKAINTQWVNTLARKVWQLEFELQNEQEDKYNPRKFSSDLHKGARVHILT